MLVARSDPHHWRRLPPQGQQSEHRERSKGETLHSTLLWIQTLAWPEALGEEKLPNCERPCRGSAVKAKMNGWLGAKQNCPSRHNEPTHSLKERAGPKWPKGWAQSVRGIWTGAKMNYHIAGGIRVLDLFFRMLAWNGQSKLWRCIRLESVGERGSPIFFVYFFEFHLNYFFKRIFKCALKANTNQKVEFFVDNLENN